jgi:hypothetical protein
MTELAREYECGEATIWRALASGPFEAGASARNALASIAKSYAVDISMIVSIRRVSPCPPVCSPPLTRSLSNAGHFRYWHETDMVRCPLWVRFQG